MGRWVPMPDIERLAELMEELDAAAIEYAEARLRLFDARRAIREWCDTFRTEQGAS